MEPADEDTEQSNTFDDQTSNVINIDDMPVDDVKEIGNVTQVATAEEVSTSLCAVSIYRSKVIHTVESTSVILELQHTFLFRWFSAPVVGVVATIIVTISSSYASTVVGS